MVSEAVEAGRRFRRIGAAGVFFQGGAAAIDSATVGRPQVRYLGIEVDDALEISEQIRALHNLKA